MPYSNLRSIAVFVGRANKPGWARSTKPPFYAGWPCSGPSCIVVKNPAGYISFCLNILYLNLMIQETIVTWPVQTGWFRNDTIFKPVCSDYCWIFIFFVFIFHQRRESLCHRYRAENWRFRASILRFVSLNKTDYHKPFNYQPHFLGTAYWTVLYFYLIW